MERNPIEYATKITIAAIEHGKLGDDADKAAAFFEKMYDVINRCQKSWVASLESAVTVIEHGQTSNE